MPSMQMSELREVQHGVRTERRFVILQVILQELDLSEREHNTRSKFP